MIPSPFRRAPLTALALLAAATLSPLLAQNAPTPTPGVPVPGVPVPAPGGPGRQPGQPGRPGAPGGNVAVDGPVEAPPATADLLKTGIAMPNASIIKVILPIYQQLTNKRVILDTNIADNNVRVVVKGPITQPDMVDFIERTLLLNGFAFVPTNRDDTIKLINAAGGQPLRAQGGPIYTNKIPLPETDQVITYVMILEFIKPEEAATIFTSTIQTNSYGIISPVANASAVIIYDDVAIVRKLIALKELVDVPSALLENRWFALERADAEKAAEFLTEVLDTEGEKEGARSVRAGSGAPAPGGAPGGAPAPAGGSDGGSSSGPSIKIVADIRRNAVLVVARPIDMKYIEQLIKDYDSESKAKTFLKRPLKFIMASELLVPLENALSREVGDQSSGGSSSGGATPGGSGRTSNNATRSGSSSGSSRSSGTNSGGFGGGSSSFGGGSGGFGGGGGGSGGSLGDPDSPPVAESVVIGKTLLVADNERNTIIVSGPPESIRLVNEIIDQLDFRPRQVLLSTIIGQMTLGNNREFGLNALRSLGPVNGNENFLGAGSLGAGNFPRRTNAGTGTDPDTDGGIFDIGDLTDPTNFPALSGLNLYGKINEDLRVYLKLMESENKFKVLQRPVLFGANNRKAMISSGQRIAVPTNSFQSGGNVNGATQSTNIEYRDVVLKLEVIPLINSENEVTLKILQINDKVVGTQVIDTNELPIIGTEELETTVTVTNGQTVVLGGLITERTERTINGVPILIQIPLIKHLFGTTSDEKRREELLIFIQPKILDTSDQLLDSNIAEVNRLPKGEEIVEFAVPEYKQIKADLEARDAAAQPRPAQQTRPRSAGGMFQKSQLFGQ